MSNRKSQITTITGLCFLLIGVSNLFERIDAKLSDNQSLAINIAAVLVGILIISLIYKKASKKS